MGVGLFTNFKQGDKFMYPNILFLGLTLYDICLCVAIAACFAAFGILADKVRIPAKLQTFAALCGVFGVGLGYGSAVLFQAFYNIKERGEFIIDENTGATFYGGLIGGAAVFLAIYFIAGHFKFKDNSHLKAFFSIANCAAACIALAHSIGRVGCLFAGCCHGFRTDAWYGIMMHGSDGYHKYLPTQLMEAMFLLLLFAFLTVQLLTSKKSACNLSSYLIFYGIWRFFIEYLRADYRGDTVVEWLTPSQFIAILLVLVGIALIFVELAVSKKIDESFNSFDDEAIVQATDGDSIEKVDNTDEVKE